MKCRQCSTRELTSGDIDGLCCSCRNYNMIKRDNKNIIRTQFNLWFKNQKDIPAEYIKIINENFWDLI